METQAAGSISSTQDALNKARSLLAKLHNKSEKGRGIIFQDSRQAAQTLCGTIDLLQSLQTFLIKESISWEPSSPEWKVVKALLELLIRLGISPHLSPGVGIRRDKQLEAASCVLAHDFSGLSLSDPSLQCSVLAPHSGLPVLFVCAEVLASFIWHTSSTNEVPRSLPSMCPATHLHEPGSTDAKVALLSMRGLDASPSTDGSKLNLDKNDPSTNSSNAYTLLFPSIAQLAMKFFLWDLMAAYLQLGFGPKDSGEDVIVCAQHAKVRLKHMVENFPVEQVIVASFVLLNREAPAPPPWLKAELGKQLSKLVMRSGGLITIMEELVGRVTKWVTIDKGNVESYDKVAGHLAKVPKSVATADEYFEAICPQVLPLLLLKHQPKDVVRGETSLTALSNIHHTAVSLACKLFSTESALVKKYLVQPVMRALLALNSMQKKMDMAVGLSVEHLIKQHVKLPIMENEVVDSIVQMAVLLTAGGSQGSSAAREAILVEIRGVAVLSIKLHFQLAPDEDPNSSASSPGSDRRVSKDVNRSASDSKGITRGFLQRGLGVDGSSEQTQNILSKLKSSLTDVVMAELNQPVELALPCVLPFLLESDMEMVRWPQEGEVWKALQLKAFHKGSKAMYLSRMLLVVENWPLVLALMGELLRKILNLRQVLIRSNGSKTSVAGDLLRYMHDFEELNNEVGTKALEHDTCGASSLLKALLDDELVLTDEDVLELVLHMVNSVLKGFHSLGSDDADLSSKWSHACRLALADLLSSIERVYSNACVNEKSRQMCFTLAEEVSTLCRAL